MPSMCRIADGTREIILRNGQVVHIKNINLGTTFHWGFTGLSDRARQVQS